MNRDGKSRRQKELVFSGWRSGGTVLAGFVLFFFLILLPSGKDESCQKS